MSDQTVDEKLLYSLNSIQSKFIDFRLLGVIDDESAKKFVEDVLDDVKPFLKKMPESVVKLLNSPDFYQEKMVDFLKTCSDGTGIANDELLDNIESIIVNSSNKLDGIGWNCQSLPRARVTSPLKPSSAIIYTFFICHVSPNAYLFYNKNIFT